MNPHHFGDPPLTCHPVMVQILVVHGRIPLKLETEFASTSAVSWMLQSGTSTIIHVYLDLVFAAIAAITREPAEVNKLTPLC